MLGAKRIFNPAARMRLYLRPKRLAHQNRRALSGGSLANVVTSCHPQFYRPYMLAYIQALAGYGTMVGKKRSGL